MFNSVDKDKKLNTGKVVIGFDLSDSFSQISFYAEGADEPETLSAVAGTEVYNIPTVLAKRPNVGQWFYGREALTYAKNGGILVDNLLTKAREGEEVIVESDAYDPVALLTLFIKRSLSMLTLRVSAKNIEAFMFTVDKLDQRLVEVLSRVVTGLSLKCRQITYQSHVESFYHYMIHQPEDLWRSKVLILEYNNYLKSLRFEASHNTTPEVVLINTEEYTDIRKMTWSEDERTRDLQKSKFDETFKDTCERILDNNDVRTVYLLGDGFKEDWADESLKLLCDGRRVFQGNNLYSKGACYAVMDKINPSAESKRFVYLGEDKLKSNVGLKVLRHGEDSYYAILDAGNSWFDAKRSFDIILDEGNEITFTVTSVAGGLISGRTIVLDGLPDRPMGTTRLNVQVEMTSVSELSVRIEDMGFGMIINKSGKVWNSSFKV